MEAAAELETWQEAFEKHPIATTRAIERQLRASAANNRDKLRVLVGSNYRELLSTAEQIITLETQTKSAESHLSNIGQQCHPPNYRKQSGPNIPKRRLLAQLRLLQRCIVVVKSAIDRGNLLLSAQLTVVSRLLLRSLGEDEALLKSVEQCRDRIASLRRQLLRRIDLVLTSPRTSSSIMVQTSCSYCLVTSSSFQDVVRHVGRLRLERLRKSLDDEDPSDQNLLRGLRYYIASLRVIEHLTGRAMIDALGSLQKRPILQEPDIATLDLLDLKSLQTLVPDEVLTFIPYFKRTPFASDEVRKTLADWSTNAAPILAKALNQLVSQKDDTDSVLSLRKELFSALLPVYFSVPGSSALYKALRGVINERVEGISVQHVEALGRYTISGTSSTGGTPSLWSEDLATVSLDRGADIFLRHVHSRRRGVTPQLGRDSRSLRAWLSATRKIMTTFDSLKDVRWRDVMEEPDDEQEDEANAIVKEMGRDDSTRYISQTTKALREGFVRFENNIVESISKDMDEDISASHTVQHLRYLREMVLPIRQSFQSEANFEKVEELIPRLHQIVANSIASEVCPESEVVSPTDSQQLIQNVPSPEAFNFLRQLSLTMSTVGGTDTWSPAAVKVLKAAVAVRVLNNGIHVKSAFDKAYLHTALDKIAESGDDAESQTKAARDYWNRTKLLFGILSS
jgi:conserved oligomeric Golgi complex subunit 1